MVPGVPGGSFLGGDGWSLSANDQRGDSKDDRGRGDSGGTTVTVGGNPYLTNQAGLSISSVGLMGIAGVLLGAIYLMSKR